MSAHNQVISASAAEAFIHEGFVVVRKAFARATARALVAEVWSRIEEKRRARSTWRRPNVQVEELITTGPIDEIFTPRYRSSVDNLVGAGRWKTSHGIGWVILRFPGFHTGPWRPPDAGWHVDGMNFQHHVTSAEQGLVGIEMLTDIQPGGAGTAVRVGSHRTIARRLRAAEPHGLSYKELRAISEEIADLPVVEITGRAGDVLWMHPYLVHARSPNAGRRVRIAANRCIELLEPLRLDRPNAGDYSLVERAVLDALDT